MVSSRDLRLANGKRRASRSPEASTSVPKRTAASPGGSSAILADFFDCVVNATELRIELKSTTAEYDRATREYIAMAPKFAQFPAIKEQKSKFKERAHAKLQQIRDLIEQQELRKQQSHSTFADLIDQVSRTQIPSATSEQMQAQCSQVENLQTKVHALETEVESLKSAQNGSLAALEADIKQIWNNIQANQEALESLKRAQNESIAALETAVEKIQVDSQADKKALEVKFEQVQDGSRTDKEACMDVLDEGLQSLRVTLDTECQARLNKLEGGLEAALSCLQRKVSALQEKIQGMETAPPSNVEQPGLLKFLPVPPPEGSDDEEGPQQGTISEINSAIEMLKGVTSHHTRLINNLTTDELHKSMIDTLSTMYPDAKNYQLSIDAIRSKILDTEKQVRASISNTSLVVV